MVEPYTPAIDEMLTITPPVGCCIICLPAHLHPRKTPLRLICTTVFQPLTEMSSGLARNEAPALLIITSRRPHSWVTRSTMAFTCSSWRTSSAIEKALRPRLRISFSTGSRCSSLRLQIATSAPAREVGRPLAARGEARALGAHHAVEVLGQPSHFLEVVVHARPRFLGRTLVARPGGSGQDGEQQEDEGVTHRLQYSESAAPRL